MEPAASRIVLLPRFSSFYGAGTFNTPPVSIRAFGSANVMAWQGTAIGTLLTFSIALQQSPDLQAWSTLATYSPGANTEFVLPVVFSMDWLRVQVTLAGTAPGVNCWAVADLWPRSAAGG